MERRSFIRSCGLICYSVTAFSFLLEGCKTSYVSSVLSSGNILSVRKTDVRKGKAALVKASGYAEPICVSQTESGDYSAVLMLCTHKGCELSLAGKYLLCPCHGSEFKSTGEVLSPPANQDLQKFQVTTDNENILIHL